MLAPMQMDEVMCMPPRDSDPFAVWRDEGDPSSSTAGGPRARLESFGDPGEMRDDAFASTVEGTVVRTGRECLWLRGLTANEGDALGEVCVAHELPASIDLQPLVGLAVRATIVSDEAARPGAPWGRTLTINGDDGRVWLVARSGPVKGITHRLTSRGAPLNAALSQRPRGPLVIGTSELQWLVPLRDSVNVTLPTGESFRVLFTERRPDGAASYVIADESLVVQARS
jgi:hypothetical protein